MGYYEHKTKEELLEIVEKLEKKVEGLSSELDSLKKGRFRERYSTRILDALPDMLTVFDHNANIVELASSPTTNHVEGTTAESIINSNVRDIVPEEAYESVRQNMDKVIRTGKSSIAEHSFKKDAERLRQDDLKVMKLGRIEYLENYTTMSGEVRTVTTMKTVVPSGGQHPYIIGVSWDVTEIKKTEKELIAARVKAEEADRMKSSFLANMSHEIRTPLNAIVGFSKLIIEAENEYEKRQYADIVEYNSTILLNLFNDILDLSALEAGSLEFAYHPVKLKDICLQLHELYVKSVKPEVRLMLDEVDPQLCIQGDWERISQILVNLITNAIKFTSAGEIHFGFQEKADMVQFYVSDTGKGIPAERVATIFQRFGKIDDFVQGTGLGLTICRMLVEKMGGRIWVRSKQGKGTVFYFTLPVKR